MKRLTLIVVFLAACWMITSARAGMITVTGTSATAAVMDCNKQAPLFTTCSQSNAAGTGTAVADVLAGHLGVLASATAQTFIGSTATLFIGLALNDMTADDFLQIDMSLHGSFTNAPGNGAAVSLSIDDTNSISTVGIGCNLYNVQNYGAPCYPGGGTLRTTIPLANLDTLYLNWLLQPGLGTPPAFSDFLNSADFTLTVPSGTNLVNNPGGTLFQVPGQTVPEPNPSLLVVSGLLLVLLLGPPASNRWGWRFRLSRTRDHPTQL
jgi:hypothetical protein